MALSFFWEGVVSNKIKIYHDYLIARNLLKDGCPLAHPQPTLYGKYI
jgi:hypothetical protein